MANIIYDDYGYCIEIDDKIISVGCIGTEEEKRLHAEETIQQYLQEKKKYEEENPSQLDIIEQSVISTALTTEYMACLQEVNSETI